MTSQEKMREEFEVECSIWTSNYAKKDKNGNYLDMTVHSKWVTWQVAWQAALHSVEAEKEKIREPVSCEDRLPEPADADMYGDLLWLRSGIWVLGKQRNGVPVDATHWMHTP